MRNNEVKKALNYLLGEALFSKYTKETHTKVRECYAIVNMVLTEYDAYEDLEEQLGCPLEVYVKLHKIASVYTKMGKCKLLKILDQSIVIRINDNITYLPLSEYKKSWFLKKDKSE